MALKIGILVVIDNYSRFTMSDIGTDYTNNKKLICYSARRNFDAWAVTMATWSNYVQNNTVLYTWQDLLFLSTYTRPFPTASF